MQNYVIQGLCYLSESTNQEENYKILKRKVDFLYAEEKAQVDFYINEYNSTGAFPAVYRFLKRFSIQREDIPEIDSNTYDRLISYLNKQEWNWQKDRLISTSDKETEAKILSEMDVLFNASSSSESIKVVDSDDIDTASHLDRNSNEGVIIPFREVIDGFGLLQKGMTMGIIAGQGSAKTSTAINILYKNSFVEGKNGLYFYLEDLDRRYHYQLLSRRSYDTGDNIPSLLMKQGFTDESSKNKFLEFEKRYKKEKKGRIKFVGMSNFSNDPYIFAQQFAHILKENQIDFFIFDYLQKIANFMPNKWKELEYLNRFGSILTSVALGSINGYQTSGIIIAQITKDAAKRAEKSGGSISLQDACGVSAIEKDAVLVIHTYVNPKLVGFMNYQMLKSRDSALENKPMVTPCDLEYCYIGERSGSEKTFTTESLDSLLSKFSVL